jgi:ribonucrease Y
MTVPLVALAIALFAAALAITTFAARLRSTSGNRRSESAVAATQAAIEVANSESAWLVAAAREEALQARQAAFDELAARQAALDALEGRLAERAGWLETRRAAAAERRQAIEERRAAIAAAEVEASAARSEVEQRLEVVAGLGQDEAATSVLARVDQELAADHPRRVERSADGRIGDLVPTAQMLISDAVQRQDVSHIDQAPRGAPVSLEGLDEPSRERLLNALTVVGEATATELGVDVERNQATLRGLDPVGREIARQASLEVVDRRLRAEEVGPLLLRTRRDLWREIVARGERALWDMALAGRPELAELLGILHYRFSYGQNALLHCQETGNLCAALAAELRMDTAAARQAGLLHDIGKAVDHEVEGSHAIIGGELLAVLGHDPGIVHAVKAHHFDEEPSTDLAVLTICADAISASRPGARRDTLTTYLQRLEQLQQIATRHPGVERAFPMQAGREVRISVRPDKVADERVPELCGEIAREIEAEMTYPGMIKVTVIRETAASATAS